MFEAVMFVFFMCGDPIYVVSQDAEGEMIVISVEALDTVPEAGAAFAEDFNQKPKMIQVEMDKDLGLICT